MSQLSLSWQHYPADLYASSTAKLGKIACKQSNRKPEAHSLESMQPALSVVSVFPAPWFCQGSTTLVAVPLLAARPALHRIQAHALKVEPLDGAVRVVARNHLAIRHLHPTYPLLACCHTRSSTKAQSDQLQRHAPAGSSSTQARGRRPALRLAGLLPAGVQQHPPRQLPGQPRGPPAPLAGRLSLVAAPTLVSAG